MNSRLKDFAFPTCFVRNPILPRHGHKAIPFLISDKSSPFVRNQFKDLLVSKKSVWGILLLWGGNYGIVGDISVFTLGEPLIRLHVKHLPFPLIFGSILLPSL